MGLRSWYDSYVMPRLVTLACGQEPIARLRAEVVPLAEGSVLEVGCGGGLNQRFYDAGRVTAFAGFDPSEPLLEGARRSARERGWSADIRQGVAEDIPFPASSFDTVVCTFTMCSVADQAQAIAEMRRVLKPGGKLLFLEHGRAPDAAVARWQGRVEPLWTAIAGGCHLTRQVGAALRAGGLAVEPLGRGYLPRTPRILGWMEWGLARKSAL
ncbi:class I SAM-dependent methyltransferase [Tsuneonella sp. YG55]|uniref:Class I SAM-dependent methyltransferase n=1 Tax=Tsuneonella litorea TaxID=2976475 RepID=A0A9X3AMQ2_9SPHN|nr:class I SAM-dependent methyltransferase [Tsuneonella litorea]MCT2558737.1 class I SAM-dependent methyltransferase [Tsuneonella litorea]